MRDLKKYIRKTPDASPKYKITELQDIVIDESNIRGVASTRSGLRLSSTFVEQSASREHEDWRCLYIAFTVVLLIAHALESSNAGAEHQEWSLFWIAEVVMFAYVLFFAYSSYVRTLLFSEEELRFVSRVVLAAYVNLNSYAGDARLS